MFKNYNEKLLLPELVVTFFFFSILVRLSERMGDEGKGKLEVFQPALQSWKPACMTSWDPHTSPKAICSMLGYRLVFIKCDFHRR